jgi:hypothetical protein
VPALPRSVGFGPVAEPPFWPGQRRCPGSLGSSRSDPPRAGAPRALDAGAPTRRPPASPASGASNSSRSRSPSPQAASPTERLSAARTEYRSTQLGSRSADGRLLDVGAAAAEAAQSRSRDHRAEADEPSPTPTHAIRARSVRRCKVQGAAPGMQAFEQPCMGRTVGGLPAGRKASGRHKRSVRAWIVVVRAPRERPMAWFCSPLRPPRRGGRPSRRWCRSAPREVSRVCRAAASAPTSSSHPASARGS